MAAMRFCFYWILIATNLIIAGKAFAVENNNQPATLNGTVNYSGMVVVPPCVISIANPDDIVEMETVRSNQFSGLGSWANPQHFIIQVSGCNDRVSDDIDIMFSGVTDGKDPQVFQAGYGTNAAQGIGLGIFNSDDQLLLPNTHKTTIKVPHKIGEGTRNLHYTAKYRATSLNVTPGDASAVVYFSASYP